MSKREETPAPAEQRAQIKALWTHNNALREGETWYPVSFKWYDVWKNYVGFESDEEVKTNGAAPGPIDNIGLQKAGMPGVLKAGLREDYDHVLLPAPIWAKLEAWFGCDVSFPRKVLVSDLTFQARIELFPQPCNLHVVKADGSMDTEATSVLLGRELTVAEALGECCGKLNRDTKTSRLWAKVGDDSEYHLAGPTMKVGDIAGNDATTEIAVETQTATGEWIRDGDASAEASSDGGDAEGPTEEFDEAAWRASVKVGDHVDAQDTDGRFFESVVTHVQTTPKDSVKVHYRGWSSKWDTWIERSSSKLQPLFTKVKNFRDFRVNDKIELKHADRWFEASVVSVKKADGKVQVKCPSAGVASKWVDIQSDDLCDLGTHCKKRSVARSGNTTFNFRKNRTGRPAVPGAVGLMNLGNTCFMNSMLQCLSNTEGLTKFFMSNEYRKDINTTNALGNGGRLAESYANLLASMWGGNYTVVCPTEFKSEIGKFAPQFSGYQQQDSQELMSFLLDGLHEDLNRVKVKKPTTTVESDGRPDEVVAKEAWATHLIRNSSVVVDMFQGQLKSDVTCDKCSRQSITFDPFMSLSVPIPVKHLRDLTVTFIGYEGAVPLRYSAKVEKAGSVADVKAWFQENEGMDPETLLLGDTYNHRIVRFLTDRRPIVEIRDSDVIFVYQVPTYEGDPEPDTTPAKPTATSHRFGGYAKTTVPDHKLTRYADGCVHLMYRHKARVHGIERMQPHGDPLIISLYSITGERGVMPTNNQVRAAIFQTVKRLLKNSESLTAETAPYTIHVEEKQGYGRVSKEVPANDEKLVMDPHKDAFFLSFGESEFTDEWDFEELVHWEPHSSFHTRISAAADISLQDCLNKFATKEQLGKDDMWYCSSCKEHRPAFKKFDLWSLPEVLVIHLKRFQYSRGAYYVHRNKIDHVVDFPFELDMSDRVRGPTPHGSLYELYAVSNHSGDLGMGHYTAYGKNFKNGVWYNFNDSSVSEVADPSRIVSSRSYVLFYRRKRA